MTSLGDAFDTARTLLDLGGATIWVIAALSVLTLGLILWKTWMLARFGAWSGGQATRDAVDAWIAGDETAAIGKLAGRSSLRARLAHAAMTARRDPTLDDAAAEAETGRVARGLLAQARSGLRALDLVITIAPLLGLLGTVLGMIVAFRTLQDTGSRADPAALAGGIWEALLTTAAGMAVAIPAGVALTWFDSVIDGIRHDMEDAATRIFLRPRLGEAARRDTALRAAE